MKIGKYLVVISFLYALVVNGERPSYVPPAQTDEISDPYEKWNRKFFQFNLFLDKAFLRPVAAIYDTILPQWGQDRVSHFTANLKQPLIFINYALQKNKDAANKSLWRFFVNSSIGIGGLFDVSSKATNDLLVAEQDFGLTAAHYGIKSGPYLMLPIFGPSTVRDTGGLFLDFVLNPMTYYLSNDFLWADKTIELVNTRNENREFLEHIEMTSMDIYATIRSLYIQKRMGKPKGMVVTPNYDEYYYQEPNNFKGEKNEKIN
jgi:phospholipid-binding lipoprotein MlaA